MKGKERQQKTRGDGNGKLNNNNNLQQMTWSSPRFPDLTKTAIKHICLKNETNRAMKRNETERERKQL